MIDKCPENEEDWQKAAAIKNCSMYAHQCDNPDKFVYHCAVNPYINETLEVCAIQKTIVRGKKILGSTKILLLFVPLALNLSINQSIPVIMIVYHN